MRVLPGCAVTLRYSLSDEHGNFLYASEEPVHFTVGEGEILPAFEEAIMEMEVGEKKTFILSPEDAFGAYTPEHTFQIEREQLESSLGESVEPGQVLTFHTPEGETFQFRVTEVDENFVHVDANHPLAGKTLVYTVEILAIE